MATLSGVVNKFYEEYSSSTPKKLKIIDAYLTYIFFTGVVQFVYCCMVGTFPFNAFLAGFISSVASFVLAVCLRLQVKLLMMSYQKTNIFFLARLILPTSPSLPESVPRGHLPISSLPTLSFISS